MAKRKLPRRLSVPGLVKFGEADPGAWAGSKDATLFQLAARMQVAEQALQDAMDELGQAERRLSDLVTDRPPARQPAWFVAIARKEQAAGDALEQVYQQIARTRAHTKEGLGIKLRLLAALYGGISDETADEADMVSLLINSLIEDATAE